MHQDCGNSGLWSYYLVLCPSLRPFSVHWFHTFITVITGCPVGAELSPYGKPFFPVWTHTHADIGPFHVHKAYCISFRFSTSFEGSGLAEQGITLTIDDIRDFTVGPMCTPFLSKHNKLCCTHLLSLDSFGPFFFGFFQANIFGCCTFHKW